MDKNEEKILVSAYSYSGETRDMAKIISKTVGGDFKAIIPKKAYPESYTKALERSEIEIKIEKEPKLKDPVDISQYDTIFIGSPNWFKTIAPPVRTFLNQNDFTGKKVVPFATHGGGGEPKCLADIAELAKGADIIEGFSLNRDKISLTNIKKCLKKIGFLK